MPVLGITGGIATGKSTFTRRLLPLLDGTLFDADAAARALLSDNAKVISQVQETFEEALGSAPRKEQKIDRARLREIVFHDPAKRKQLEDILHPLIRQEWMAQAELARAGSRWLLVDIPLLYESGLEAEFNAVVVVACRAATQKARIVLERGLSEEIAERIIAAQQSLESKIARADHVIWSESPSARLEEQAQILATHLRGRFHET